MKSFFRGKMEGFEKEKIEKYDKCTYFFSNSEWLFIIYLGAFV